MISREMIKKANEKEKEESKEDNIVKLVIDKQKMFTCIKYSTCKFLALNPALRHLIIMLIVSIPLRS